MKFGLKEEIIKQTQDIFSKYQEIEKVILYGSRAKNNYKNGSDIDLTLHGKNLNLSVIGKINSELDDLPTPYTFDISIFHKISNPDLIEHINRVGMLFYQKKIKNSLFSND